MTKIKAFAKAIIDVWAEDHNVELSAESYKSLQHRFASALETIKEEYSKQGSDCEELSEESKVRPLYIDSKFNMGTLEAKLINRDRVGKTVTVSGMNFYICKAVGDAHVNVIYSNDRYYASKGAYIGQYIVADGKNWRILSVGDTAKVHAKY